MTEQNAYRALQARAKELGLKYVGVSHEELERTVAEAENTSGEPKVPETQEDDRALEAVVQKMGRETAEQLRKAPRETVIIARDPLNKHDKYVWVGINGWNFQIEREKPVTLPVPVIELLEQARNAHDAPSYILRRVR